MKFLPRGKSTSDVEVTNVSQHGFWIVIGGRKVTAVELPSPHHLYWPKLDVDLAVDSLDHPDRYPLVSRSHLGQKRMPARRGA